jgi:hypothetical protein
MIKDNLIMPRGKYYGKSIEEIAKKDPDYLFFIYRKSGFGGAIKNWIWDHREELKENSRNNEFAIRKN